MADVKSTSIIPISLYCFILGAYFLYLAVNVILSSAFLSGGWLPTAFFVMMGVGLFVVGQGILKIKKVYWKILFVTLAIFISSMASFIIAFLIFLIVDIKFLDPYFKTIQTSSASWFSFLGIFLSGIIVLYYLTHKEVLSCFGEMGDLMSPF